MSLDHYSKNLIHRFFLQIEDIMTFDEDIDIKFTIQRINLVDFEYFTHLK